MLNHSAKAGRILRGAHGRGLLAPAAVLRRLALRYAVPALMMLMCTRARMFSDIAPFAMAFFAAGLMADWSVPAMLVGCLLGMELRIGDVGGLWPMLGAVLLLTGYYTFNSLIVKSTKQSAERAWLTPERVLAAMVGLATLLPRLALGNNETYDAAMALIGAAGAAFMTPPMITGLRINLGRQSLLPEEQLSLMLLVAALCLGMAGMSVLGIGLSACLAVALTLSCAQRGAAQGTLGGVLLGMVLAFSGASPLTIAALGICGMMAGAVIRLGRWAAALACLAGQLIAAFYLAPEGSALLTVTEAALGCAAWLALPGKWRGRMDAWMQESPATGGVVEDSADALMAALVTQRAEAIGEAAEEVGIQFAHIRDQEQSRVARAAQLELGVLSAMIRDIPGGAAQPNGYMSAKDARQTALAVLERLGIPAAKVFASPGATLSITIERAQGRWDDASARGLAGPLGEALGVALRVADEGLSGKRLTLCQASRLGVSVGVATRPKSTGTPSGDTYAVRSMEAGRVMAALSDGMGSGERAAKESAASVKLLEKLLKAGLVPDMALESVNRLMLLRGRDEMFATMDLCMLDLMDERVEIMKLGACMTLIKRGERVTRVPGGQLPLGVLDSVSPTGRTLSLRAGDTLVMLSDGVADPALPAQEQAITQALISSKATGAQSLADALLGTAQRFRGKGMDDMTVLVLKITGRAA